MLTGVLQYGQALSRQQEHLAPDTSAKKEPDLGSPRQKDILPNSPPKSVAPDASLRPKTGTSIVRGFSRDRSRKPHTQLATTAILQAERTKNGATYTLGWSPSGGGDGGGGACSLEFRFLGGPRGLRKYADKTASFNEEVATRAFHADESENDFEDTDKEEEDCSESAVEEWKDDDEPSGPPSFNEEEMFQRVDSKPNLQSSLLTSMMREEDGAATVRNAASRFSRTVRRSRHRPSPPINVPQRVPQPSNTPPRALSPRTTRRLMLSHELSKSFREELLRERQDKKSTINAALKRSSTAPSESHPTITLSSMQLHKVNSCSSYFDVW